MHRVFHAGELLVQERAGVRERAARVGGSITAEIPAAAAEFLEERRFVVLATADRRGRPWASILNGPPGFARVIGPRSVRLDAEPPAGDPVLEGLASPGVAGLLAIDPATRRRMRLNGRIVLADGAFVVHADQVYGNCPKYITPRAADPALGPRPKLAASPAAGLTDQQRAWIRQADTFFVASTNPGEGADASHRGGPPGFVEVDGDRLAWPDYAGNMMYNTLGNIAAHPRAGLLVPDFTSGARLMLTGTARIDWTPSRAALVPGAQRMVELDVEEVRELR